MKRNISVLLRNIFFIVGIFILFIGCHQSAKKHGNGGENSTGAYTNYKAGTIVLKDGTFVLQEKYTSINNSNPPIAILIGSKNSQGKNLAIGLHNKNLAWANSSSSGGGYNTKFEKIICTPSESGMGAADKATFTGDTDGSDNWSEICKADTNAATNAENYPAFKWINEYRTKTGAHNWYLPSIAELCKIYKNREIINTSLKKIYELDNAAADNGLGTGWYWSSSQTHDAISSAWYLNFSNGEIRKDGKSNQHNVCCIAAF